MGREAIPVGRALDLLECLDLSQDFGPFGNRTTGMTVGSPPPSERATLGANFEGMVRARRSTNTNGLQQTCCNPLIILAEWTGLEPATPGVTGRYSNQLNYHSSFFFKPLSGRLHSPNIGSRRWRPLGDSSQPPTIYNLSC